MPAAGVVTQPFRLRTTSVPGSSVQVNKMPPSEATTVQSPVPPPPPPPPPPPLKNAVIVRFEFGVVKTWLRLRPSLHRSKVNVVPPRDCWLLIVSSRVTPTTLLKVDCVVRSVPSRANTKPLGSLSTVMSTTLGSIRCVTVVDVPSESVAVR